MIISVCGPLGYAAARELYNKNREALQARFAGFFIRQFESISDELISECPVPDTPAVKYCEEVHEGGIYRALWEAAEVLGCGMRINNAAIPILQEIVEILELFSESPYECSSKGSWLIISEEEISGITFAEEELSAGQNDKKHIPIIRIGITTDDKARILEDGDSVRYLTPPARQEKDINDRITGRTY